MSGCVDLRERFGSRYRIRADESAACPSRNTDPWLWIVPCQYGEIYPYGGQHLCVLVKSAKVANEMRSWPELNLLQDSDDAVVFRFDVGVFGKGCRASWTQENGVKRRQ